MFNISLTAVILVQVVGLSGGGFLVDTIFQLNNKVLGDLLPVGVEMTKDLQTIKIRPLNNIGLISFPFNLTCKYPLLNQYVACFICNQDCVYVHNTFGGTCAANPRKKSEQTCICARTAEEARERNISISATETCKSIIGFPLGKLVDDTFKTVLLARMKGLECVQYKNKHYEESGCSTDCKFNHGIVNGGYCDITPPRDSRLGTEPTLHCECRNSTSDFE